MRCKSYNFRKSETIFPAKAAAATVALFALCLLLNACARLLEMNSEAQKISDAIEISDEWTEITPPAPLRSTAGIQKVSVRTGAVETFDESDKTNRTLKFKNGKSGKVEAVLFDNEGNSYELQLTGIGGAGGGFYLGRKHGERSGNEPPDAQPDFPPERVLTKLKIRSEVPFRSEKIEWIAEIQK